MHRAAKKKKKKEETTASTDLSSLSSPSQIGVSKALDITLPGAYSAKKTALEFDLTAGKRSQDACQAGEAMRWDIGHPFLGKLKSK